jgi:uncharacterized protein
MMTTARRQISIERKELAGIPCLFATPGQTIETSPTVLIYHGWGGSADGYRFLATMLARSGYVAVVPEVPLHGERGALAEYDVEATMLHFWDVVTSAVDEAEGLVQAVAAQPQVDSTRIAIVGHSMGGTIAASVFAKHAELVTLVCINGTSGWEITDAHTRQLFEVPPAEGEELAMFRKYDPMNAVGQLYPRAMLLMHGLADEVLPIIGQEAFYEKVLPHYEQAAERLKFVKVERLNHFITMGMLDEMFAWFDTHL